MDIYYGFNLNFPYQVVSARVNNKSEGLNFRVYNNKDVEFLDVRNHSGMRTYVRSLCFILYKAVSELFPQGKLYVEHPVSKGYFCNLRIGRPIELEDVIAIKKRMQEIIDEDIPFHRTECHTTEAVRIFSERGMTDKVKLLETSGDLYTYGMIWYTPPKTETNDNDDPWDDVYTPGELTITNGSTGEEGKSYEFNYLDGVRSGKMGGVTTDISGTKLGSVISLTEKKGILRSQFDLTTMTLTTNEMVIPVAENVECYNKVTGEWYKVEGEDGNKEALKLALAFSNDLTVYYDRAPEEGGKIRVVVAE